MTAGHNKILCAAVICWCVGGLGASACVDLDTTWRQPDMLDLGANERSSSGVRGERDTGWAPATSASEKRLDPVNPECSGLTTLPMTSSFASIRLTLSSMKCNDLSFLSLSSACVIAYDAHSASEKPLTW